MTWPWNKRVHLLRLHLLVPPGASPVESVEGIGRLKLEAGHYRLSAPKALEGVDRTQELNGELVVLADRVLFVQVLG